MAPAVEDFGHLVGLINAGETARVRALLTPPLVSEPSDYRAWFLRGESLLRDDDAPGAERLLARALLLCPEPLADIAYRLGVARLSLGSSGGAEEALDLAIRLAPERAAQCVDIGRMAFERGFFGLSEKLIRHATKIAPDMLMAWLGLIDCLFLQGRGDDAVDAMAAVVRLDPERIDVAERLVQTAVFTDQAALAETVSLEIAARSPESARAQTLAGWLYRVLYRYEEAASFFERAAALDPDSAEIQAHLGVVLRHAGRIAEAEKHLARALALDANAIEAVLGLAEINLDRGGHQSAGDILDAYDARVDFPKPAARSVVIPVLDYSPGSPHNILTLLDDLALFPGEVICVFNGDQVFADLKDHPRIDKWAYNKFNAGVGRGWNIGINLAEGDTIHILNADLKVSVAMLDRLEYWLNTLPDALCVGVTGHWMDYDTLVEVNSLNSGAFHQPVIADKVSGQLFSLHAKRLHDAGITFDPRLSPYFGEETDLAFKARQNGLRIYAVPETDFFHAWGISKRDRPIQYMGRPVHRLRHMTRNRILLQGKWARIKPTLRED